MKAQGPVEAYSADSKDDRGGEAHGEWVLPFDRSAARELRAVVAAAPAAHLAPLRAAGWRSGPRRRPDPGGKRARLPGVRRLPRQGRRVYLAVPDRRQR